MSKFDGLLHNAANNGEVDRIQEFLALGADPNSTNKHGDTALLLAVRKGNNDAVRVLIAATGNPFKHTHGRLSPIAEAISNGDSTIFETLLSSPAQPTSDETREALRWAVISAEVGFLKRLLERRVEPQLVQHSLDVARHWLGLAEYRKDYRERLENVITTLEHVTPTA